VGLFYNAPEPTRGACRGTGVRGRCDLLSEFFGYLLPARRWSCSPAIIWTCCAWFVDVTTTRPCRSLPSCVLRLDTLLANWRGSTSPTTSTAVPYRHFLTTNTPPLVFATAVSYTVFLSLAEGPRDAPCQLKPSEMSHKCSSNCI